MCRETLAVPRNRDGLETYSAALHMNYPVNYHPAIQYSPSVKAFKLCQTVCRAGRAA